MAPEGRVVRRALIAAAAAIVFAIVVLFTVFVFAAALEQGAAAYVRALTEPDALAAVRLTLVAAALAVPANLLSASPPPGRSPSSNFAARERS